MAGKKDVAVVVPIWRTKITKGEETSLLQLEKHLERYDRFFLAPDNLTEGEVNRKGYKVVRFHKSYFTNRNGYNKLLLQEKFYKAFSNYKFVLIYQLDALVFSDQLLTWVNKGYDYIAAPLFNSIIATMSHKNSSPVTGGNGGFSLRNISKSLEVLKKTTMLSKRKTTSRFVQKLWFLMAVLTGRSHKIWLNAATDNYPFNEDGFWSLEAPKYVSSYRVAPLKESLKFAFDEFPRKCFELNGKKLPFGCHAWEKYDKEFWLPYLEV